MWLAKDEFFFVWKKIGGRPELSATISIWSNSGIGHRKAVLIIFRPVVYFHCQIVLTLRLRAVIDELLSPVAELSDCGRCLKEAAYSAK